MVRLTHNGVRSEVEPRDGVTLQIVLARGEAAAPNDVVVRLAVDGRTVPEDALGAALAAPLAGMREVEVETRPRVEVARGGLDSAADYARDVVAALRRAAGAFQTGHTAEGGAILADGLDALSVLLLAVELVSRELGAPGRAIAGMGDDLQPRLEALLEAHRQADWVRLADVLEHEVALALDGWRGRLEDARSGARCDG